MSLWEDVMQLDKSKCKNIGQKFESASWTDLSDLDKKNTLDELANFLVERLKIEKEPEIRVSQLDEAHGAYDMEKNLIEINEKDFRQNGLLAAVTIAHELRNAYQFIYYVPWWKKLNDKFFKSPIENRLEYFKNNLENDPVKLWRDNYLDYKQDSPEYENQPIEYDAFRYEKEFLEKFFTN